MRHELTALVTLRLRSGQAPLRAGLAGGLIILLAGLVIYQPLLFPASPDQVYPWGSDTWGHLVKVIYLDQQISQGNFYPDLFPAWYSGIQLLRYHAPLPYYLLVGLLRVTDNIWWAGNLFLFLMGLGGGLSFLLYRRWLGWLPAVAAGVLFMGLPDNLRVAFAEGNLPRALATALLPLTFYFFLRLTASPEGKVLKHPLMEAKRWEFLAVAVCVGLLVLSHAMMAAIFVVCCVLFALIAGLMGGNPVRIFGRGVLALGAGLLLSGCWLLPSLTGGITEIDQQAASDSLARFPLTTSLNPAVRASDQEAYYLGLSLVAGLVIAFVFWKRLDPWLKSLAVTAFITALISSTIASGLYNALPFHHLFWPIRYLSFAGFAMLLLLAGLAAYLGQCASAQSERWVTPSDSLLIPTRSDEVANPRGSTSSPRADLMPAHPELVEGWAGEFRAFINRFGITGWGLRKLGAVALLVIIFIDFNPSLKLVRGREQPDDLVRFSQRLAELPGWRVATADLSRLGSAPSYLFSHPGGREQVFGWAFQGSVTAPLLARINQAIVDGYSAYTIDRLSLLGADDVVVLRQPEIPGAFPRALEEAGFQLDQSAHDLQLYHRDGAPRASTISHQVLSIGRGAENLALIFPQAVSGGSVYLDDYDQSFLDQFDQLFLSGFKWRNKEDAEDVVKRFMANGGQRVVVDLTGVPTEARSQRPKFLGVYGELVPGIAQADLNIDGEIRSLLPFDAQVQPWHTHTPQGVDETLVEFTYALTEGVVLGVKDLGEQQVHFLGLNLVYHALLTRDPVAVGLLEGMFGLTAGQLPDREVIALQDYQAGQDGYRFNYETDQDAQVLVPVAYHAGTQVYLDGQPVPSQSIDRLTLVTFKQGAHLVELRFTKTLIYHAGRAATGLGVLVVVVYCVGLRWRRLPFPLLSKKKVSPHGAGG